MVCCVPKGEVRPQCTQRKGRTSLGLRAVRHIGSGQGLQSRILWIEILPLTLLWAVWPWASPMTSLDLSFYMFKMGMITVSIAVGRVGIKWVRMFSSAWQVPDIQKMGDVCGGVRMTFKRRYCWVVLTFYEFPLEYEVDVGGLMEGIMEGMAGDDWDWEQFFYVRKLSAYLVDEHVQFLGLTELDGGSRRSQWVWS